MSDKTYSENKEILRQVFHRVTDNDSYRNRTYSGDGFISDIIDFENAWYSLIYSSSDFNSNEEWMDKTSFEHKIEKWFCWDIHLNAELYKMYSDGDAMSCPEFLDDIFDITYRFLNARTREEESQALNVTYNILFDIDKEENKVVLDVAKHVWITEEDLDMKSGLLPMYARETCYGLEKRPTKRHYKEVVKVLRRAVKKGLIKNIKVNKKEQA